MKYEETLSLFKAAPSAKQEAEELSKLLQEKLPTYQNETVYKTLLSCIDLTSLQADDNSQSIETLTQKVNTFEESYPDLPCVAALCVYPNFVETVRMFLEVSEVKIAAVCGGFPSGQTFPEIKVAETALAITDGADEIDIVINLGKLRQGEIEEVGEEIEEIKSACRGVPLKVILESGILKEAKAIRQATLIALKAGADFIKTSTGKQGIGATPEAAYTICKAIREYSDKTGRSVGFKAAGGIRTTEEALIYYTIASEVLGKDWLNPERFRIGASQLANDLLQKITNEKKAFF